PVDVLPERGIHPVLAKVEPALAVKQATDLHHPHIVVGVAEREEADVTPLVVDEPGRNAEPPEEDDPLPMAIDRDRDLRLPVPLLAFPHFSRCSRSTLNGKQRAHGLRIKRQSSNLWPARPLRARRFVPRRDLFGDLLVPRDLCDAAGGGRRHSPPPRRDARLCAATP